MSRLRNTMTDERISYLVVLHIHKHKDVNVDNDVSKYIATNSNNNNNNNIYFLIINNFIFTIKRPIYIYIFSIITQVIIEILALSLAENGVIFRYNHLCRGDYSGRTNFQNNRLAFCQCVRRVH